MFSYNQVNVITCRGNRIPVRYLLRYCVWISRSIDIYIVWAMRYFSSRYCRRIQKIWSEELSYCRSWLMMVIVSIAMRASHSLLSHREPILSNLLQSYTGCTIFTRLYTGWLHVLPGPVWKARLPKISFQLVQGFLKSFGQSFPFESQRFFDDVMNQIDLGLCGALQGFHQLQQGSEIYNK